MTQWSIWGGFMKKTRGQKSRATVPLRCVCVNRDKFSKGRLLLYIYVKDKLHQRQQYFFSNLPSLKY